MDKLTSSLMSRETLDDAEVRELLGLPPAKRNDEAEP